MIQRLPFVMGLVVLALLSANRPVVAEDFAWDDARPAAGHWVGSFSTDTGFNAFAALLIDQSGADPTIDLTCLGLGLIHQAATVAVFEGRVARLAFAAGGRTLRLELEVSADGQSLTGTGSMGEGNGGSVTLRREPRPLDLLAPMAFTGSLEVPGAGALEIALVLADTPGGGLVGHIDIPMQGVRALPLTRITVHEGVVAMTLPVPAPATIEGRFDETRRRFAGEFRQGPFTLDFAVDRDDSYAWRDTPRPQHPTRPYPYREREITLQAGAGITIAGTLTLPDDTAHGPGPYPTAVLISGSGQQDRDETILGHKPFLVIADHLTRHGVAVLRYDDRGVGGSTVDDPALVTGATSHDFAKDVLAIVRHLRTIPEIDGARLGLVGHSEGGIIAPLVATMTDDLAYLVLLAGPGVPGRDILALQLALGLKANGADPAIADSVTAHMRRAVDLVLSGADATAVHDALVPAAEATVRAAGLDADPATVGPVVQSYRGLISSPWAAYFLAHDPLPVLREVTCPVLAMNGTLDMQVWHEQNLDTIEEAMTGAGREITIRRCEGLNHLFQPAGTGAASEYASIETTFDEAALRQMTDWILQRTGGTRDE